MSVLWAVRPEERITYSCDSPRERLAVPAAIVLNVPKTPAVNFLQPKGRKNDVPDPASVYFSQYGHV